MAFELNKGLDEASDPDKVGVQIPLAKIYFMRERASSLSRPAE